MKKCRKCKVEKELTEFRENKTAKNGLRSECKSCEKEYREKNKERIKERNKEWREKNKEYLIERAKEWNKQNRERVNELARERNKEKRKTDPLFKMKCNLRKRTWRAFKSKGYSKNSKTQEMLGIDWEVCKKHIERQFTIGMSWDNYGEWHIDHIIPLASANTEEDLKILFHYTNLQPLWAYENISKGDSINGQQTLLRL